jgi:PAS domain S-box-containing protein
MLQNLANWLVDPSGLTPHGFCLLWEPGLIWTHALSDSAIGLAYYTIPLALVIVARRRRDLVFRPVFALFAAFIVLCGTVHWLDLVTLWVPAYGLQGVVKVATAATSVVTAITLWRLLPQALSLPSPAQLKHANQALQESERRHRASFQHSPVPLHTLDGDGIVTGVSQSWLELLGYPEAEVVGQPIEAFWPKGAAAWGMADKPRLFQTGEVRDAEQRFCHRNGTAVETLVSSRLERREGTVWIVCVLIDVTARKQAESALQASEERLRQAQKMEAVGQLTGGIAHDFNNMLQGIGGCLELMERRIAEGRAAEAARYVGPARQSVDRAAGLTHRMLAFARRQTLQPRPLDPNALVTGMADLLRGSMGPGIMVRYDLQENVGWALCDSNQLESALLNLAINARDAMPQGGTLTISTAHRAIGSPHGGTEPDMAEAETAAPGLYVEIAVSDTGFGMTPEIIAHAYEPFFTTKPIGQGTGLGLSQIYGFVRQSGGVVLLRSAVNKGTTVRLLLPRDTSEQPTPMALPAPHSNDGTISGTVLLVEDEASVRAFIVEVLQELGCEVLEAKDGISGLQLVNTAPHAGLLITDIGLPGLNGRQLAEAARVAQHKLPILLISGYAGQVLDDTDLAPGVEVLRKPFAADDLVKRVRNLLSPSLV